VSSDVSSSPWTDDEIRANIRRCPKCGRTVWQMTPVNLSDPCPRDRQRIVEVMGESYGKFSKCAPMRNHLGKWVREAHECDVPLVEKHPKRGWKPDPKNPTGEIYDMG
jgi:hypothetical protein